MEVGVGEDEDVASAQAEEEGRSLHFSKGDKADIREQPNHLALFNAYKENRVFHKIVHHLI